MFEAPEGTNSAPSITSAFLELTSDSGEPNRQKVSD